jgi:hypothetical protein
MSRLDSFIRRLEAQRACLDWAISAAQSLRGAVVELGLGNGRTYDHLRSRLAGSRLIYALDRQLAAHPDCVPEGDRLVLGDFAETLPALARRLGASVALVHADAGSGDQAANQAQARGLPALIDPLLTAGAVVISDQELASSAALGWATQPLPTSVEPGRYFLYRKS